MGQSRNTGRRMAAVVTVLIAAFTLTACSPTGESVAAGRVEAIAGELGESLAPPFIFSRDADWLVVRDIPQLNDSAGNDERVSVEALNWSGNSSDEAGAQIEVRIRVEVDTHHAATIGGISYDAGSATRCYHYAVIGYRFYDTLSRNDIPCPDGPAPPLPTPTPIPALPDDAGDRLTAVLLATTPEAVEGDVRESFPQPFVSVETVAVDGQIIAAVGVPVERECIVAVRDIDGVVIVYGGFDREWLQPGELGCSTELVTNPPL